MRHKTAQRIDGAALESIMQDVLQGIQEFTSEACLAGDTAGMEILAVEKPDMPGADIIPLRRKP
jgi:hypothetical protein